MKINIISTAPPTECGIGITNHYLMEGMKQFLKTRNLSSKDINLYRITHPKSINPFHFIKLILQARHCDILHIQYNHDCFGSFTSRINGFQNFFLYPIAKVFKTHLVTTFHEVSDVSNSGPIKKWFYHVLNYFPLHFSEHIIVTTEEAKELIIKQDHMPPDMISVIPLGAITNAKKLNKHAARKLLKIPMDANVITQFGFIDSNKGHDKIIDILDSMENTLYLIAGSTRSKKGEKYLSFLMDKIHEKELESQVKFLGFINEKDYPKVIGASDVLVFPYSDITSSLALTTALSYNVPILTSNITPFEKFKEKFGGIITTDVNSHSLLLHSIRLLLDNHNVVKPLINNQKYFVDKFSWKSIASKTFNIYKNLYGGTI